VFIWVHLWFFLFEVIMSNFSNDSDLLAHEPMVFHELPFAGQTKLRVMNAAISGQTITSATGGFSTLAAGDVVILGDGAFAITAVVDDNTLTLAIPPVGVADGTLIVRTFATQAALVHEELLRAMGVEESDASSIVSIALVRQLEVLGTLARAYAAAVGTAGDSRRILEKADRYRARFTRGLLAAAIELDLDADGRVDTVRHPGIGRWVRR
jgi:hypothetical protein